MRKELACWLLGMAALAGCSSKPVPRVSVPNEPIPEAGPPLVVKPMPGPTRDDLPMPPFDDVPLVNQQAPETPAFVQAYTAVGRPRVVVFVNRTLQGETLPVNSTDPLLSVDHTRTSTTGVTVDRRNTQTIDGVYHTDNREQSDRFESKGPAQYKETTAVYLHPGQYDEASAKSIDYEAIENTLTDFLSGDGQVTIMSPTLVRQKLTEQQIRDLESGRAQVASEIVQQLGADILVQAAAHPTQQTQQGLKVRLVCEAMNIKGGQSLGRVVVDLPPPLEKTTINRFARFCARKLMHDMTLTWSAPPPVAPAAVAPATPMDHAPPAPASAAPTTMPEKP